MYRLLALLLLFNFAFGHFHHDFDDDDDDCEFDDSGPGPHGHHHGPGHDHGPGYHHGPGHDHGSGHHYGPGYHHGPGHHQGPGWMHPWHDHPEESNFDKLARYVISADKQVYNSCKQSPYSRVRVLPGADMYALKYNLPEFIESGVKVQIKHRVILATAEAQGIASFKDLRIIPANVKVADASWFFDKGTLTVLMPYKNPLHTEVALDCIADINESVINVSKMTNSDDDLRTLDDTPQKSV